MPQTIRIGIVGGGAAGMFAAMAACATAGSHARTCEVHLFERNARCGIKILISGGGKCNVTHLGPIEEVLRLGFPERGEARFLKHAFYRFTNESVLRMLERHGVGWYARDNGRIFPTSSRAEDVLQAFERECALQAKETGARLFEHTRSRVDTIAKTERGWSVTANGVAYEFDRLILATGGLSYRKVGTTGDGLRFAEGLGHTVVPIRAALAPIYLWRPPAQELGGVALRDVELLIFRGEKILARKPGDVLLTHKGISGPATLDISREAALHIESDPIRIAVRLVEEKDIDRLLLALGRERIQQQVSTWLEEILPNRFVPFVMQQAGVPDDRKWSALTRPERVSLRTALVRYDFGEVREIPIDRGEVTAGGVSLKEVDPKTMMSRSHRGLFFAGEVLDVAGEIGGYNLQAAYSTGWVAGEAAVALE